MHHLLSFNHILWLYHLDHIQIVQEFGNTATNVLNVLEGLESIEEYKDVQKFAADLGDALQMYAEEEMRRAYYESKQIDEELNNL